MENTPHVVGYTVMTSRSAMSGSNCMARNSKAACPQPPFEGFTVSPEAFFSFRMWIL
jgi:hypothetical protein